MGIAINTDSVSSSGIERNKFRHVRTIYCRFVVYFLKKIRGLAREIWFTLFKLNLIQFNLNLKRRKMMMIVERLN